MLRGFADLHHSGLFRSLQLAGERIGFDIYRPYGLEWFSEGFFGIAEPYNNALDTVKQFLSIDENPADWSPTLNNTLNLVNNNGIATFNDYANGGFNLGITLQAFKDNKFDFIICTHPNNVDKFVKLRDLYQPSAKLILHLGNLAWSINDKYPNIWDSTNWIGYTSQLQGRNYVRLHQEFDLKVFKAQKVNRDTAIRSFILGYAGGPYLQLLQNYCSGYAWEIFGVAEGANKQPITGISKIAELMNSSLLGLHIKTDDGYGHILHNFAACGVPMFVHPRSYDGRFGERLLIPNETCVELTFDIIQDMNNINYYSQPEVNEPMREKIRQNFETVVSFEQEGELLRQFLADLK